ncbi:MAG: hypothetical protein KJN72_12195 [Woeseia sp.]|nr:hypothetical protein [Woeseia sp.]
MIKQTIIALFLLLPGICLGAVIFQDNFDSQSAAWNLGQGALPTPAGQSGTWGYLASNRKTCTQLGCGNCNTLPADADDNILYMDDNGGMNGTQALRWVMKNGCSINDYPASLDWRIPVSAYKEIYFGFHLKMDPEWKTTGPQQCKFPLWIALGDSALEGKIWVVNRDMTMPPSSNIELFHITATPNFGWFKSGITVAEYGDGQWHWLEFRIKLNSTSGGTDGLMTAWIDGVQQGTRTNLTFWPSTGSQSDWIYAIRFMIGNCSSGVNAWANPNWAGFRVDNFKGGTSYIGPPESSGGIPIPQNLRFSFE